MRFMDVSPLCQFAPWTFRPKTFGRWTYSTFPAYSVKTQAPSFGCFLTAHFISQCACHAELKKYLLTYLPGAKRVGAKRPGAN